MIDIILVCAKYFIIILFAYFTYLSFRAQRDVPDERKRLTYTLQMIMMLLIHAVAFLVIGIHVGTDADIKLKMGQVIGLYAGQLVYLIAMSLVIPKFVSLSRGLNNVMCMFLTIGFIIQTRLDFDTSLRQFIIVIVGTGVFLVCVFLCKRAKFMRNLTWVYGAAGMALLAMVLVLSRVVSGAKLALNLGFFSFQPAEFVKILFVLFVASAFFRSKTMKTVFLTAACAAIHVLILVFCHDLGSALILFVIYVLMLYVATKRVIVLGAGAVCFVIAAFVAYRIFPHVAGRITAWIDPWSDIDKGGYQLAQGLFAVGTGGWFGSGLYGGMPESVPMVSNDMIFSAIAEELGGIFAILLILLCLCFVLMVFRVAIRVNNPFYKLLSFGLGAAYGFQVFLTIGGTTKFIPLTGVNLPFISSGGSSLLASMIMIGMIQALYVISEADVERERELVAAGVPLRDEKEPGEAERVKRRKKKRGGEESPPARERILEVRPEDGFAEETEYHIAPEEEVYQVELRQDAFDDPEDTWETDLSEEERMRAERIKNMSQTKRIREVRPEPEGRSQKSRIREVKPEEDRPSRKKKKIRQIEDDEF